MDKDHIELAAAIENLRKQLQVAIKAGEKEDLRFAVQDIEIELQCIAKKEGVGKFGVEFWVINAEAEGTIGRERVQTVKLKLKPVSKDGDDLLVNDEGDVK